MKNKYNEQLRRKYRHQTVSFESFDLCSDAELEALGTNGENDDEERDEEYVRVRREIGRLIKIYREVTVRHYMHGYSVEGIANELGISQGTVKSRLSNARNQIKEGIVKMEKYSSLSYEPKKVSIGIWGGYSIRSEPFTLY
jgi:RNA polymerase sigma factor (sigma-70 family)